MRSAALPSFYNLWGRIDAVESLEPDMTFVVLRALRCGGAPTCGNRDHFSCDLCNRYNLTIERSFNAPRFGGQTSLLFVSGVRHCGVVALGFTETLLTL